MSLGSTHRQEFFDLIKSLIVDYFGVPCPWIALL